MRLLLWISIFLNATFLYAQISPPGLGEANYASWFALGLKQDLNAKNSIHSMTYVGVGIKTEENQYINKPAILVLNQEFYHHLNNKIDLSYAASYRRQKEYENLPNKTNNQFSIQQEFRIYGRFSYTFKVANINFKQTARQELRRFVNQDFIDTNEPLQLRTRIKSQIVFNLDNQKRHKISTGAEALFSTSKNQETKNWSGIKYKEARFTFFYTYNPIKTPLAFSLGYMNNLIQNNTTHSVHYTSVNIVWKNPFKNFENKQ